MSTDALRRQAAQLLAAKAVMDKYGATAALEETQEIRAEWSAGVYVKDSDAVWFRAPELSERYPTTHTRLGARQAD